MFDFVTLYLVTIVPPVAKAVTNLKTQNAQNHGTNAVAIPEINWMKTATTKGPRLPNLMIERNKNERRKKSRRKLQFNEIKTWLNLIQTYRLTFQKTCFQLRCQT